MLQLHYYDSYKVARKQEFASLDEALLAFSACSTLPDFYPVHSIILDGKLLDYQGDMGGVYPFLYSLSQKK